MSSTTAPVRPRHRAGPVMAAGVITAGVAAALNLAIWVVARAADLDLLFVPYGSTAPETVPAAAVAMLSVVPLLIATLVLAGFRAKLRRPDRAWVTTVASLTVLSLAMLVDEHLTGGDRVALGLMHLVSGALAATLLPRLLDRARTS